MKKLILSAAVLLSIVSCKKQTETETVETTAPAVEQTVTEEAPQAVSNTLTIEGNDQMQFNVTELHAKTGEPITLTLKHTGSSEAKVMGHNFVLLKPGSNVDQFGIDAAKSSLEENYIPKEHADQVIAHTKVVGGGESDTITIDALEPGTYDFLCSFPGHYGNMKGKLIVE